MKKILRLRAAKELTGLSRSSIYLMMRAGTFPKNISLGARAVGRVPPPVVQEHFRRHYRPRNSERQGRPYALLYRCTH